MKSLNNASFALLAILLATSAPAMGADTDPHAEDRAEMRAMMAGIQEALNEQDLDALRPYLDENAVVTFHDTEVAQGFDELRAYYEDKLGSASAVLTDYSTAGEVDGPAIFHGDTAVAFGHANDRFHFRGGKEIALTTRWTATLRDSEAGWKIIALHFSADLFDNPLLHGMERAALYSGLGGALAGLVLGFILFRRRRSATA